MNLEVGFEVYWNDPDEHVCSGYGTIVKIKGDIYCLKMDNGEEVEAFKYELSQMRDCMFIIITFIASVLVVLATGIYIETLQDLIMGYKIPDLKEDIEAAVFDYMDKLIENGDINPQFGQQIAEDIAYDILDKQFEKIER